MNPPSTYNRWFVPVAALLIHICIGSVYAWSTFNKPINTILNAGADAWMKAPYITFSTALILLGLSAAFGGPWVERNGPRKTAACAAGFFCSGLVIGAIGLSTASPWLVFLGMGLVCGIGCGLGYIAPVSTLVKWFPDRRGMATGFAVMGFGGGAFVAGKLNVFLIDRIGIVNGLVSLAAAYLVLMLAGAFIIRPAPTAAAKRTSESSLTRNQALSTPQFWLMWGILFINVTAGIGILEQASPMIQEMFPVGAMHGSKGIGPAAAGAFVALLSLFNMAGRFCWSSLSDYIGRKNVYIVFLLLGAALYCLIPLSGSTGSPVLFISVCAVIISMYGGGFATAPAYLKDLFGTMQVGAIHGRLLTAWSAAGILGPMLVNHLRVYLLQSGAKGVALYAPTMYLMAGLLLVGLVCNLLIHPVDARYHYKGNTPSTPRRSDDDAHLPHIPGTRLST